MKSKLRQILGRADDVLENYAFVLMSSLLAAICVMILHDDGKRNFSENKEYFFMSFAYVSGLGISLFFALNMLAERIGKKLLLNIAGVIFLTLFFVFVFPKDVKDFTENYAYVLVVSFILSHLLVSFIAFIGNKNEINFWQYNKNLFINIVLTGIFTAVLTGGVELAILAIDKLFDFGFKGRTYFYTFAFLAIFGSSFIFLLFNEDGLKFLEKDGNYPVVLKFFVQFVLIPLLIIYVFILYLYGGKILLEWQLPRGWVSYLISAYSLVGILALLLVHPLKGEASKSWVQGFSKIFYYTLFPLLILLFVAIFTRILEYGYTENRYYVLLIAIWLSCVVVYFSFFRKTNIKFIPISLFVFGLFSLIFPYFNTFSVAKRSQKNEMKNILTTHQLLVDGKIDFNKKVNDTVAREISNKFDFLKNRKEVEFLKSFISEKDLEKSKFLKTDKPWESNGNIYAYFKNIENNQNIDSSSVIQIISKKKFFTITGYDYVAEFYGNPNDEAFGFEGHTLSIERNVYNEEPKFIIHLENSLMQKESYDVTPFILKIIEENQYNNPPVKLNEISTEFTLHGYQMKADFNQIVYHKYPNSKNNLNVEGILIFIKKKK